jgi:hypothetical protein
VLLVLANSPIWLLVVWPLQSANHLKTWQDSGAVSSARSDLILACTKCVGSPKTLLVLLPQPLFYLAVLVPGLAPTPRTVQLGLHVPRKCSMHTNLNLLPIRPTRACVVTLTACTDDVPLCVRVGVVRVDPCHRFSLSFACLLLVYLSLPPPPPHLRYMQQIGMEYIHPVQPYSKYPLATPAET